MRGSAVVTGRHAGKLFSDEVGGEVNDPWMLCDESQDDDIGDLGVRGLSNPPRSHVFGLQCTIVSVQQRKRIADFGGDFDLWRLPDGPIA
jgi:hypothetical protein